jgi:hypothetical protein
MVRGRRDGVRSAADTHGSAAALKMAWASEMSEVCQGLALTRLIFNTHRSEDGEIESLLHEAQTLRQEAGLRAPLAETMNALGSLKQKQRAYTDAEHCAREPRRVPSSHFALEPPLPPRARRHRG